jgi:hypothetical protein
MIVIPIGSYYATVDAIFKGSEPLRRLSVFRTGSLTNLTGNSTYAGGLAAILANVVLIAYVIVAMMEDQGEQKKGVPQEGKKDR